MRSGGIFDYETKHERLEEVQRELEVPSVWEDPARAQSLGKERAQLERVVQTITGLSSGLEDAEQLLELARDDDDAETASAVREDLDALEARLEELEFQRMFSGEMDAANAFVDIQSGSGGTEAQDWAEMLLRCICAGPRTTASKPRSSSTPRAMWRGSRAAPCG